MGPYEGRGLLDDEAEGIGADREISLSPGIILGVFLALALVCAVFFGFGYSVGRRSTPTAIVSAAEPAGSTPQAGAVSHSVDDSLTPAGDRSLEPQPSKRSAEVPGEETEVVAPQSKQPASHHDEAVSAAIPNSAKAPAGFHPPTTFAIPEVVTPEAAVSRGIFVQVAAFTHQQDAQLVASALTHRGYAASIRQQPQDKLLHVQMGPFASKKEAEAMRQRLQTDGYNAIVK